MAASGGWRDSLASAVSQAACPRSHLPSLRPKVLEEGDALAGVQAPSAGLSGRGGSGWGVVGCERRSPGTRLEFNQSNQSNQLPAGPAMTTQTIGLFEAKTHLSELVARAEAGEEIVITRHNRPVARIVPMAPEPSFDPVRRREAIEGLRRLREELRSKGMTMSSDEIVQTLHEMREEQTERKMRAAGLLKD